MNRNYSQSLLCRCGCWSPPASSSWRAEAAAPLLPPPPSLCWPALRALTEKKQTNNYRRINRPAAFSPQSGTYSAVRAASWRRRAGTSPLWSEGCHVGPLRSWWPADRSHSPLWHAGCWSPEHWLPSPPLTLLQSKNISERERSLQLETLTLQPAERNIYTS